MLGRKYRNPWFPIDFPSITSLSLPVLTIRIARKAFSARTRRSSTMFFGSPSDFRGDFRLGCAPIAGLIHGKSIENKWITGGDPIIPVLESHQVAPFMFFLRESAELFHENMGNSSRLKKATTNDDHLGLFGPCNAKACTQSAAVTRLKLGYQTWYIITSKNVVK